jgi:hypothetical protein
MQTLGPGLSSNRNSPTQYLCRLCQHYIQHPWHYVCLPLAHSLVAMRQPLCSGQGTLDATGAEGYIWDNMKNITVRQAGAAKI